MNTRTSLALFVLLLAPLAGLHAADKKPNIVFIFADDWGWGDLSCHGHPLLKTPNLDRLASEGIDFQQFNVLNPVCSPSRTAVMTGQFPARLSVHQHFASLQQIISAECPTGSTPMRRRCRDFSKQAGYRTGHFGKWHLTSQLVPDAPPPTAYGFDEYKVFNFADRQRRLHDTADNAVAFIKANKDHPFYVNVWLHEGHTPHVPTKESMERWKVLEDAQQVYAAVITDGDNAVEKVLAALNELIWKTTRSSSFLQDNGPEWTGGVRHKKMGEGYGTFYSVGRPGGFAGANAVCSKAACGCRLLFAGPDIRRPEGGQDDGGYRGRSSADLFAAAGCDTCRPIIMAMARTSWERSPAIQVRTQPIFWEWQGTGQSPTGGLAWPCARAIGNS